MANRTSNRLSAQFVKTTEKAGLQCDGNGLYLQVSSGARGVNKSWVFKYPRNRKTVEMGLGSYMDISLQDARKKATDCRNMLLDGKDPLHERQLVKSLEIPTFGKCCEDYIDGHKKDWTNPKSEVQWRNSLAKDAKKLTNIQVDRITPQLVLQVLNPIWDTKNDTARKVRGRIETVLDYAKSLGYCKGDNPASMKGNLEFSLSSTQTRDHRPSLSWRALPGFIEELRLSKSVSRLALEFTILTATRSKEAIRAEWSEIDLIKKLWIIPKERMKAKREHAIPLSTSAMNILKQQQGVDQKWVFFNEATKKPLSDMAMLEVVRGMTPHLDQFSKKPIVVHGFRSTFRTWASESTNYPAEIAEAALAHKNPNKVEAAYLRSPQHKNRMHLMENYARLAEGMLNLEAIVQFGK